VGTKLLTQIIARGEGRGERREGSDNNRLSTFVGRVKVRFEGESPGVPSLSSGM